MDLVQEILFEVRDSGLFALEPEDFHTDRLPGTWESKNVSYHLVLLLEEGFLAHSRFHKGGESVETDGEENAGLRLTWKGHDLLEELTDQTSYL